MGYRWVCPYCGHPQTVTTNIAVHAMGGIEGSSHHGKLTLSVVSISCSNSDCRELTLKISLYEWSGSYRNGEPTIEGDAKFVWPLLPESKAKPQPDFIPKPIRDDYYEACRIRDLSPKASATLARRAIQGVIRDFFNIAKATLDAEIKELRKQVDDGTAVERIDPAVVDGIDHVRSIGNIGAHMEKDINLIIDVEPEEAQLLIELLETLFDELYVAREKRRRRLADLAAAADAKKLIKEQVKLAALPAQKRLAGPAEE